MQKALCAMAAAVLFASQAGAATITGPTTVQAGVSYTYQYQTDAPADLLPGYTLYTMYLEINGGIAASGGGIENYWGTTYTDGDIFSFNWVFPVTGPASLTIRSVLATYIDATILEIDDYFEVVEGPNKIAETFNSGFAFDGDDRLPATLQISVVPIGGTLPLMLSALGIFGWAARRRAKQNALPA